MAFRDIPQTATQFAGLRSGMTLGHAQQSKLSFLAALENISQRVFADYQRKKQLEEEKKKRNQQIAMTSASILASALLAPALQAGVGATGTQMGGLSEMGMIGNYGGYLPPNPGLNPVFGI